MVEGGAGFRIGAFGGTRFVASGVDGERAATTKRGPPILKTGAICLMEGRASSRPTILLASKQKTLERKAASSRRSPNFFCADKGRVTGVWGAIARGGQSVGGNLHCVASGVVGHFSPVGRREF